MAPSSKVVRGEGANVIRKLISTKPGRITWLTKEEYQYMMDNARDPLLVEREKMHGSFRRNSEAWEALRQTINRHRIAMLYPQQELALNMILVKISRMLQQPQIKDHWDDIAGYAKLGSEACEPEEPSRVSYSSAACL